MESLIRALGCISLVCILIAIPILFGICIALGKTDAAFFVGIGMLFEIIGLVCILYESDGKHRV